MQKITPFLWFDHQAEEAANFYASIFKNSKVGHVARYDDAGAKASGRPKDSAMTVAFQLDGQDFVALNGGPHFKFTEAVSFVVNCQTQEEVDHYWEKLSAGGDEQAQQCGWLKDKYGLVVADRSGCALRDVAGQGPEEIRESHGSLAANEKAGHQGIEAGA